MKSTWKLLSVVLGILIPCVKTNNVSDYTTFVYRHCTSSIDSNESHLQALFTLFQSLLPQSSNSRYFKATAGDENETNFVSGLFQCRGDLTGRDCSNCVSNLPQVSENLCSKAAAGRIQLNGCYFRYETDEFTEEEDLNGHDLLHKFCGEKEGRGTGFEEARDEAFAAMESGVMEGHGFYSGEFGSVNVVAQCEGDLGGCDCGECVSRAALVAQEECVGSISGQIYMGRCFISYSYYPYGVSPGYRYHDKEGGFKAGKSVAIVLGGAAAIGLGLIFLKCMKSFGEKDDI